MRRFLLAALLLLSACGSDDKDKTLSVSKEGRISVLQLEQVLRPDITGVLQKISVPPPVLNAAWTTSGGNAAHVPGHVALGNDIKLVWRASIGSGADSSIPLAAPVVVGSRVFTLDAEGIVSAFDRETDKMIWRVETLPEDQEAPPSAGGLAHSGNLLIVANGLNEVLALNPDTGSVIWRAAMPAPVRSPPTLNDNRVYVITVDNELYALHASDGKRLWQHGGLTTGAMLVGGSSPAVVGDMVIAAYSSGELFALRPENGRVLWSENLAAVNRVNAAASLTDITANPVVLDDVVYAIGHSGRLMAVNRLTGRKLWQREVGGVTTPWLAGNFMYVLSNSAQLLCINRLDGKILWITALDRYEDMEEKKDPISWTAPLLAGDRLLLAGTNGTIVALSPYTGVLLGTLDADGAVLTMPVVAGGVLYILRQDGDIVAYK